MVIVLKADVSKRDAFRLDRLEFPSNNVPMNVEGNSHKIRRQRMRSESGALPVRQKKPSSGRFHEYRGLFLVAMAVLVLWMNVAFIVPVMMGAIFAIVLYPLMIRMAPWRIGVAWKAAIVTIGFAVSFLVPFGAIVFIGAEKALAQIQSLDTGNMNLSKISPNSLIEMFGLRGIIARISDWTPLSDAQIQQWAGRVLLAAGTWLARFFQSVVTNLPATTFAMVIVLLTVFFLLIDGKRAVRFLKENSIFGKFETERIAGAVNSLCFSVVVASIAAGTVQSALIVTACLITGTAGAVFLGLISLVLSFLPMIGTAPVTIFLTVQAIISGNHFATVVFAIAIVVVGLSDNIVRPFVLKGGARLHPLIGFVAAFGALDTIGFYGVFIGPVVAGLFFTILPMVTRSYR